MNKRQEIVNVYIRDLKKNEENPRKITKTELEKIKKSIQTFGYVEPIIIDEVNTIIGGHQRVKAMQELNIQIPIRAIKLVGYDENEKKALNLALNKMGGEFDFEKVNIWLDELKMDNFNIELTGFDDLVTGLEEMEDFGAEEMEEKNKNKCPECGYEW